MVEKREIESLVRKHIESKFSSREQKPRTAIPSRAMVGNRGANTAGIMHQNQVRVKTLPAKSLSSPSAR